MSVYKVLRERVLLSEVISKFVALSRKGRNFLGLCPFHHEKSSSFSVDDRQGYYYCFGCKAHGDVVDFVSAIEGVSHGQALELLCQQYGLELPKYFEKKANPLEQSLKEVLEKACGYFEAQLETSSKALEYLAHRGLSRSLQKEYRLGWAPEGTLFAAYMKSLGCEPSLLQKSGLMNEKGQVFFQRRIIFPILDDKRGVIAFGARTLEGCMPKYLNSPETLLFVKGENLYGSCLRKVSSCLVVEGYMDALTVISQGYSAVACLGTALSPEQLFKIWKSVCEPVICFDGDEAGQSAAQRASLMALPLLKPGFSLRFMTLPLGQDPASLMDSAGKEAFEQYLKTSQPLCEFLYHQVFSSSQVSTPERKAKALRTWREYTALIQDPDVQFSYQSFFKEKFYSFKPRFFEKKKAPLMPVHIAPKEDFLGYMLLGFLIHKPSLVDIFQEELAQLFLDQDTLLRRFCDIILKGLAQCDEHDIVSFLKTQDPDAFEAVMNKSFLHLRTALTLDFKESCQYWMRLFHEHQALSFSCSSYPLQELHPGQEKALEPSLPL